MKFVLDSPAIYQLYQELGGFFGARVKAIATHLDLRPDMRIIDIGCGPGYMARHLPEGVDYIGFDINASSIAHARKRFSSLGRFYDSLFNEQAARTWAGADVVMMNGVLHHMDDATAAQTLATIGRVLKPSGVLFTLDGVYREGQNAFGRWLLDHDRGSHVRDMAGYHMLLQGAFCRVDTHLREDLSRLPYSFAIGLARAPG